MAFNLELSPKAVGELDHLNRSDIERIVKKLHWFAENFNEVKPERLTGELKGLFKFRIGDYRAIYSLDSGKQQIIILAIGHRSEVYKPNQS